MDQQLTQILEDLATQVLASPQYSGLPDEEKSAKKTEILEEFNSTILDTLVDNLTDEQVADLQTIDPNSPDMEQKIEELSSTIPDFLSLLQNKLTEKVENLKNPVPPTN